MPKETGVVNVALTVSFRYLLLGFVPGFRSMLGMHPGKRGDAIKTVLKVFEFWQGADLAGEERAFFIFPGAEELKLGGCASV